MGNIAKQCRLELFQESDFAGDLEDSKSTSGGTSCVFGSHTISAKMITVLTRYRPIVFELLKTVMTVISPGGDFSELI